MKVKIVNRKLIEIYIVIFVFVSCSVLISGKKIFILILSMICIVMCCFVYFRF